jgi:hypothetical protein
MIRHLIHLWSNRHINRGFKQPEATTRASELLLTSDHMLAFIEHKLAARKALRPDRQAAAQRGAETKRGKAV